MTDPMRDTRRSIGLTQRQLAEALGTTERQVRRWERGEATMPRTARLLLERIVRDARHVHEWRCYCGASGGIPTTSA